jgi:uncharacterized membrane protein YkvA (DUF1232 family)
MQASDVSRALTPVPGQEEYVKSRFWQKVRRTFRRVPFIQQAVAAYYAALDPVTPRRVKAALLAALAYFIMPADLVPDVIIGLGFTDDATVLFMAAKTLSPHIKERHLERAREALDAEAARSEAPAA